MDNLNILYDINSKASKLFTKLLYGTAKAQEYLGSRNLGPPVWETFNLGYCPDTSMFNKIDYLSDEDLYLVGLCDRRIKRAIMFPIINIYDKIVGFSARPLPNQPIQAKYINTKTTAAFIKGHTLYGINLAKKDILKNNLAILCEGQFDVMALYKLGIHNVVGSLGTGFTLSHARLLKRFCDRIKIVFDGDTAGEIAATRTIRILEYLNMLPIKVTLPKDTDIDQLINENESEARRLVLGTRS